ncbi:phosphatase PAP2 family protein [Aquirufa novilacunae]|uniref:Phosphatase PAP2 family protein n=1 Tax=Aquirufa novilacunae TaxID=3139305 RepID=A0ABW8U2G3_9BACT
MRLIALLCLFSLAVQAEKPSFKKWKTPLALGISSGITYNPFAKKIQTKIVAAGHLTPLDDYIQYGPAAMYVGLNIFEYQNEEKAFDQAGVFLLGTSIYVAATQGLKATITEARPDGTEKTFSSGHTATAFFGATVLAHEYRDTHPEFVIAGYTLATATGALRIANNKHWVTDVLMGSAIGIASAELAYILYPKVRHQWQKLNRFTLTPQVAPAYYGASMSIGF